MSGKRQPETHEAWKEALGTDANKTLEVSARFLALLYSCLEHCHIDAAKLKISTNTLKKWTAPNPKGEKVEKRVLIAALYALSVPLEKWRELLGLSAELVSEIDALWIAVDSSEELKHNIPRPKNHFSMEFGDTSLTKWKNIVGQAEKYVAHGVSKYADASNESSEGEGLKGAKYLWEEILDLVIIGELQPGSKLKIGDLRLSLEPRVKRTVTLQEVLRSLEELHRRGEVEIFKQQMFRVVELTSSDWEQVRDFRLSMEPLNIKFLGQEDPRFRLDVLEDLKDWLDEMERALAANDPSTFFFADIKFHCALAGSSPFRHALMRTALSFIRRAGAGLRNGETMKQLLDGHKKIFEALSVLANENAASDLREKALASAQQAMREHLELSCNLFKRET